MEDVVHGLISGAEASSGESYGSLLFACYTRNHIERLERQQFWRTFMAGSKSDWLEDAVLDHLLGESSTQLSTGAVANTLYVSLWNSTINDTWTSTSTGECAGSTYAREAVTNSSANWTNSTAGSKQNKTVIEFTTGAGSDWGTVVAFGIHDGNSTATGNMYYWGDLTVNQTIASGNTVRFSTGAVIITED